MSYKQEFRHITTFVFDVDGVFTDGGITIMPDGDMIRTMNTKDGYAVKAALHAGFNVAIISGGTNEAVRLRLQQLGVNDVYLGAHDKGPVLKEYAEKNKLSFDEILFMGDDIPDISAMNLARLGCCPNDAVPEVLEAAAYISHKDGGKGCARDVIEQVLKVQGKWGKLTDARNDSK
ncbi:MAG: HAD-IIIA family hydrolase [Flavobacteriaceae bacterium]|nr:HAD-IIIA family hydrolase [Flavobacteriaceae bacterium]